MVGVRFLAIATQTVTLRYFHTDHLGSIAVITDQNGAVAERLSYDAWGKRRFANGADDPAGSIASQTAYGFTGQEELSVTGLVHLNGRVYDSLIGRMMSADPTVPDALNPQAWNRYSYVGNDPLTFTDPTGYSWLSSFFHSIANFFRSNSIVRAIVQVVLTVILTAATGGNLALAAAASAAIVTGLSGGKLGQILKAAVIAYATTTAFQDLGLITQANASTLGEYLASSNYVANVAGSAAIGCVSAVASGGKCGPGALSAAASSAAAPLVGGITQNAPDAFTRTIEGSAISGAIGGLASVAGGGKFADGAVTGAFAYLFTSAAQQAVNDNTPGALNTATGQNGYTSQGSATSADQLPSAPTGQATALAYIAMFNLGAYYFNRKKFKLAEEVFRDGVSRGDIPSMYHLAKIYLLDNAAVGNVDKARELLERAASAGHVFAKKRLAMLLMCRHYGWRSKLRGIWMYFQAPIEGCKIAIRDPNSPLLR